MEQVVSKLNILDEIDPYLSEFPRYSIKGNELVSSSPFREDNSPSFSLNLDSGLWIDFGGQGDFRSKGNFYSLMANLTGDSYESIEDQYELLVNGKLDEIDKLELKVALPKEEHYQTYNLKELPYYEYKTNYLTNRGITEKAQKAFGIGYDKPNSSVAMPIIDIEGRVVNVKFRSVKHKQFYYLHGGQPSSHHLYGGHMVRRAKAKRVFIVESEIDALYLWSYGIPAVALSTARLSRRQELLIGLLGVEEVVLAFDNDKAGNDVYMASKRRLQGRFQLYRLVLPSNAKDVNDLPINVLEEKSFHIEKVGLELDLSI